MKDLAITSKPKTFWQKQYIYLYGEKYHSIEFKIARTAFERYVDRIADKRGVDHLFAYTGKYGEVEFTTKLVPTTLTMEMYMKQSKAPIVLAIKNDVRKVFVTEQTINGRRIGQAETYFVDNKLLTMSYQLPFDDEQAKHWIHDILTNLRFR